MRIGLVWLSQETSTFNPTPTTVKDFESFGIRRGRQIIDDLGDADGNVGGFNSVVSRRSDVEVVPVFSARAVAGGRLDRETFDFMSRELVEGLTAAMPLDGLALYLHGACSAEGIDDADGEWLHMARGVVGDIPLVLGLDHHANITERMVAGADLIVGHRTQPHQPFNTGKLAATHLLELVEGNYRPTTAWRKLPLISHQEQYLSNLWPMSAWFDRARGLEAAFPQVIQISNFPMQPWLDIEDAGWATVVHTDGDQALADRLADELADLAWSLRAEFQVKTSVPVAEAVARAEAAERGVVVISDTGDSVLGGGGGDSTAILHEVIAQGVRGPGLITLVDRDIRSLVGDATVGDTVTLEVGGGVAGMHEPVTLTGTLRHVGPIVLTPANYSVPTVDNGFGVLLETAFGMVTISELPGFGGVLPDVWTHFGVDPADYKFAVVKTASNFQWFASYSSEVIRADTPGPTQSDMPSLPWTRIPRPMYPLDDIEHRS